MTTVALLGTGIMGAPIARNLLGAGFDVTVWNRTRSKAEALTSDGAIVAGTPRDAVAGADILMTVLLDSDAVEAAVTGTDGALAGLDDSAPLLWLQLSTVGVDGTERLAGIAADAGVTFVDAPVLGTKQPAEQGALTVLASGPVDAQDRCREVFDAIGQKTIWCGEAGYGSRLKLVVNSWVLALTTATAEALALAGGLDIDPKLFLETIEGGPLDVAYAHVKGGAMLEQKFPTAFPLAGAAKDAGLIVDAAQQAGLRLLVADAVRHQMSTAAEAGHGEEDMSAVWYAATAG